MAKITPPVISLAVLALASSSVFAQTDFVVELPQTQVRSFEKLDYAHARPVQPKISAFNRLDLSAHSAQLNTKAGVVEGGIGNAQSLPVQLLSTEASQKRVNNPTAASGRAFGTAGLPFTTSRVDMGGLQLSKVDYFRRAGRLFFKVGADTGVCSAALLKPGIVVTAAHCVAEFGSNTGYSNFQYVPAYFQGQAPYGVWSTANVYVMSSYLNGTADCAQTGVVCTNDIAVIKLAPQSNKYAGHYTGWFGYAWNNYSFIEGQTQVTQLGYPSSHDSGELMQRTDARGEIKLEFSNNTVIGSRQTEGSSGGPWLVNFGEVAKLQGTNVGSAGKPNIVIGTTSWGPSDSSEKYMGASPFTSENIVLLMKQACPTASAAGCK